MEKSTRSKCKGGVLQDRKKKSKLTKTSARTSGTRQALANCFKNRCLNEVRILFSQFIYNQSSHLHCAARQINSSVSAVAVTQLNSAAPPRTTAIKVLHIAPAQTGCFPPESHRRAEDNTRSALRPSQGVTICKCRGKGQVWTE